MQRTKTRPNSGPATPAAPFAMKRPQNGLPEDLRDHIRLMYDIIALGFQTDKTRVASLLLARDLSALYYPFLDVKNSTTAPRITTPPTTTKNTHFQMSQLAYLAQRLDAMPEGDGSVLDNSCLISCRTCGPGRSTTTRRCRSSPSAAWTAS